MWARRALDTRLLPPGDDVTLGLFREGDVRAALTMGSASTTCARRLVVRATGDDGAMVVVEDVFNPAHGLFVTSAYDEGTWRDERLAPNTVARVGAASDDSFSPVIHPGARLDVETAAGPRHGRLHVGYATVGAIDLFTDQP